MGTFSLPTASSPSSPLYLPFPRSRVSRAQWKGHLKSGARWHTWLSQPYWDGLQLQALAVHCSAHYAVSLLSLSVKNIKDECTDKGTYARQNTVSPARKQLLLFFCRNLHFLGSLGQIYSLFRWFSLIIFREPVVMAIFRSIISFCAFVCVGVRHLTFTRNS